MPTHFATCCTAPWTVGIPNFVTMKATARTQHVQRYYMARLHPASAEPVAPLEPVGLSAAALAAAGGASRSLLSTSDSVAMSRKSSIAMTGPLSLDCGTLGNVFSVSCSVLSLGAVGHHWQRDSREEAINIYVPTGNQCDVWFLLLFDPCIHHDPACGHAQGMTLDAVLGRGSYGLAYHAEWHGMEVVVKIQTQKMADARYAARDVYRAVCLSV